MQKTLVEKSTTKALKDINIPLVQNFMSYKTTYHDLNKEAVIYTISKLKCHDLNINLHG